MSEWKEYKIGELGVVITGKTPSIKNPQDWGDSIPFVTPTDFDSYNKNIYGANRYLSSIGVNRFAKNILPQNSIIVTCIGSQMGKVAINKVKCATNQQINSIKLKDAFDPDYIYYALTSMREYLQNLATGGSTMPIVNKSAFENISVNLPSLPTQRRIAAILSSLDDKIELNNAINKNLEELAQTLFKRWFVDFEFPMTEDYAASIGKPELAGQPYKSSGGEMVESEMGLIPKGWEVRTLKEEFILNMGQSPKGDTYNNNGVGKIFFQGCSDFGFRFPTARMFTTAPNKIANKFDTLISVRAPVGDLNMADTDCCIGRGIGAISHPNKLYSYCYYKMQSLQSELKMFDNEGTVFGSINKETLGNIKITKPPLEIALQCNNILADNDFEIYSLSMENQSLTNLRDFILPKLISGQIDMQND